MKIKKKVSTKRGSEGRTMTQRHTVEVVEKDEKLNCFAANCFTLTSKLQDADEQIMRLEALLNLVPNDPSWPELFFTQMDRIAELEAEANRNMEELCELRGKND